MMNAECRTKCGRRTARRRLILHSAFCTLHSFTGGGHDRRTPRIRHARRALRPAPTDRPALGLALLAGAWNGLLVSVLRIQPIIATLILMVAGRGMAQLITRGQIIPFSDPTYRFLGNGFLFALPFSLTLVAVMLAATALLT